ncbi:MAG: asparagine synthase-related protein [Terriglobales bacterium]|jgi:asparagine synthase (glutamine-hydrolysing)
MPGIFGLITKKPREWAEPQLLRMLKVLRHESFYTAGTWSNQSSGVYAGWTARENSFSDGMPVENELGDIALVFSGEEYPELATARHLKERGHEFRMDGPSYLVHLYEEDSSFPKGLNGRFQGLVSEKTSGKTTLFNDRYGMHRLYYHESKDAFYFAVEAKAILEVCPELRRPDARGLGEFVACGCVLENRTLFQGIHVLPPASTWTFRAGSVESKKTYFEPQEWENQEPLDPESYHQNLRTVFSQNLPRYLNGRERIGVSLTGGLDTRTVMAWQRFPSGSLPCYTYGEAGRDCRDVVVARQVARECQQSHQVISIGNEFLARFPYYAERSMYLTDACVDVTRAPDLYLSERAREIAPVRMTGLYGDEVLRPQARAFKPVDPVPGPFNPDFLSYVGAARQTYGEIIQCNPTSFSAFRQAPWHHYGILSLEQTQLAVRTPFLDNDFVRTAFRAPQSATANNDLRVRLIGDGSTALQRIPTDRGFAGNSGPHAWALRNFLEFTFKAEYAYDYGMPQWLAGLDHFFSRLKLERLFLGRHKLYHYRVWYRDILASYVQEMLLDSRTLARPYLERKGVEAIVRGHLKGDRNYTTEIHRLLSLELLHRLFLDAR